MATSYGSRLPAGACEPHPEVPGQRRASAARERRARALLFVHPARLGDARGAPEYKRIASRRFALLPQIAFPAPLSAEGAAVDARISRALDNAAAAPKPFKASRELLERMLDHADVVTNTIGVIVYAVGGRRAVVRTAAADRTGTAPPAPPPDPNSVDPWTADSAALAVASRRACECPTCDATGTIACALCGGTTRKPCPECLGAGRVPGARAGRTKKCPTCRARGDRACDCGTGRVPCDSCDGTARVVAWMEIEETSRQIVSVSSAPELGEVTFDPAHPNGLVVRGTFVPTGAAEPVFEPNAPPPAGLELHERVMSAHRAEHELVSATLNIRAWFTKGWIHCAGTELRVAKSDWSPVEVRRTALQWFGAIAVVGPMLAAIAHLARGDWFRGYAPPFALVGAAAVAGAALFGASRTFTLPRRTWRAISLVPLAALGMMAVAAMPLAWHLSRPGVADARDALAAGDARRAAAAANALLNGPFDDDATAVLDELHARRVLAAATAAQRCTAAAGHWFAADAKAAATRSVEEKAREETAAAAGVHDQAALLRLADSVRECSSNASHEAAIEAAIVGIERALERADVDALGREVPAEPFASCDSPRCEGLRTLACKVSQAKLVVAVGSARGTAEERVPLLRAAATLARTTEVLCGKAPTPTETELRAQADRLERRALEAKNEEVRAAEARAARARAIPDPPRSNYSGGKTCTKGCPCGNTCIACNKRCRQ